MQKRIYRSKNDRIIAGICGGLAKYFDVDPAIVRIIFLLLFFFKGIGFLAYLIMWFVIPTDPNETRVFHAPGAQNEPFEKTNQAKADEEEILDAEIIEETTTNGKSYGHYKSEKSKDNRYLVGVILIVIGGLFLLEKFFPVISLDFIIPVILIGVGAYLLFYSQNGGTKNETR
jgi:phage shock protein PspC (stress-responsive transcriptional regulator)